MEGKIVVLWGLVFKLEIDDMCEVFVLVLIDKLLKVGCKVCVYDFVVVNECKRWIGEIIYYVCDMYDVVLDVDVLMLVIEWKEFCLFLWVVVKKIML